MYGYCCEFKNLYSAQSRLNFFQLLQLKRELSLNVYCRTCRPIANDFTSAQRVVMLDHKVCGIICNRDKIFDSKKLFTLIT